MVAATRADSLRLSSFTTDQLVAGMLAQAGVRQPQRELLNAHLQQASVFIGSADLSDQEVRIGVATYLEAAGEPVGAVGVRALIGRNLWPVGSATGAAKALVDSARALPPAARKLLAGVRSAAKAERELATAVASGIVDLVSASRTDGYSTQRYTANTVSGTKVFLRATRQNTDIGHQEANRSNNTVNIMAHQLGAPHFTLPSLLIPTPSELAGTVTRDSMMVLPYAGDDFAPAGGRGGEITNPNARLMSEDDRITGAVISYLTRHNDARPNNTLVNAQGQARFIDNDNVFGRGAWFAQYGAPQNDYFKGRGLGYASDLSTYDKVPGRVRLVIDGLCALNAAQIAALYNLTEAEASTLLTQAQHVQALGLEGAIAGFPVTAQP